MPIAFIPHGHCYLWKPGLVWLHALSDGLITLAYFIIPLLLIYIVKKRGDIPFGFVFWLFGSFIICCGITHLMEIWTLWHPDYWLSGFIKAITAAVSLCTAAILLPLVPTILGIPSPAQLEGANIALKAEVDERQQAQEALRKLTQELEIRVRDRTESLAQANQQLHRENEERAKVEAALRRSQAQLLEQTQSLQAALDELQRTQTQLVNSEKMSSLGQMVAGIAHEINNPISFVYANLDPAADYIRDLLEVVYLYRRNYPETVAEIQEKIAAIDLDFMVEDLQKILGSMKVGAERIRDIVKSLRTFSRLDEAEMKKIDIHENIDSSLLILEHRLKAQPNRCAIEVIKEYGNLPPVNCYAGKLNQVFMNLLTNAIDAIELVTSSHQSGAAISPQNTSHREDAINGVSTRTPYLSPTIRIRTEVSDRHSVRIHIADNGSGMTPEVMAKIYEPFYTTKPVGKGTGLGLAISYQIIEGHGGVVCCTSEVGKGTVFVIEIPISLQEKPATILSKSVPCLGAAMLG